MPHALAARSTGEGVGGHAAFGNRPLNDRVEQFGVLVGVDLADLIRRLVGRRIGQRDAVVLEGTGQGFDVHGHTSQRNELRLAGIGQSRTHRGVITRRTVAQVRGILVVFVHQGRFRR